MRGSPMSKKHKRARSSSSSSFSVSDDNESPKQKYYKTKKSSDDKRTHRKHLKHSHKQQRHRSVDYSSDDEYRSRDRMSENNGRHKEPDLLPAIKIKEEPLSEDERERKHKRRHNEQSRFSDDAPRRNDSKHDREESRKRQEQPHSRNANERNKQPIKQEIKTEAEPEWGKKEIKKEKKEPPKNNAKPDFGLSGKLTEDANTFNGVVIKYSEPPEARKPKRRWRLYPFKGEVSLPVLHIHRQSAYLLGRDRKVADIPIDHPSCSKQHAALQYRLVPFKRIDGSSGRQIKLYVIDLESANGTFLNNNKIEAKKYYELKERDVVKFGFSSREYVILHEHSKDSENDDDVANDD